jgi:hypothetical protein
VSGVSSPREESRFPQEHLTREHALIVPIAGSPGTEVR